MWNYEKRLEYPIHIKRTDAAMTKAIISQFGGPDGETGAAMCYLSQRFADYYVDHTTGIYPVAASATPWSADTMQSTGDPITDLMENMATEVKLKFLFPMGVSLACGKTRSYFILLKQEDFDL